MEDVLNLGPEIDAVIERHGRNYHRSEEAQAEVAALWGGPDGTNDAGVFVNMERIEIRIAANCSAEVLLAISTGGLWAMATGYMSVTRGGGYACSIWNRTAYRTREDALRAGLEELIGKFEEIANSRCSSLSQSERDLAARMREELKQRVAGGLQLSLF